VKKDYLITIFFVFALSLMTSIDVIEDIQEGLPFKHWFHEVLIVVSSVLFISYKLWMAMRRDKTIKRFKNEVDSAILEVDFYKKKIHQMKINISSILDEQFKIWGLSKGESDIAILLIKGMSIKEIAELRGSSEGTVRQQCMHIYKKSKLENRNQLASYFLEDILS
jgi:DNA-binding CsgD family transcriptional regulator